MRQEGRLDEAVHGHVGLDEGRAADGVDVQHVAEGGDVDQWGGGGAGAGGVGAAVGDAVGEAGGEDWGG